MRPDQYEELCRTVVAAEEGLDLDAVQSRHVPQPMRPGALPYSHQVDLMWETTSGLARYVNIANAKWRRTAKVKQGEVELLQQVRTDVGAHKAFLFTNIGFTRNARAVAEHHGIGLHVVAPDGNLRELPDANREAFARELARLVAAGHTPYAHVVEHRGLGFTSSRDPAATRPLPRPAAPPPRETRVVTPPATRTVGGIERRAGPDGRSGSRRQS